MINSKTLLLIPAYNEENNIERVIKKIILLKKINILIINDASKDNTQKIINKYKKINLINNKINIGYCRTIQKGINYGIKKKYNYLITIDADNQFDYRTVVVKYLKYLKKFQVVIGFRDKHKRIFEKVFGFLTFIMFNISDPMCGAKGYNLNFLKKLKKIHNPKVFGFENVILMIKNGAKIKEINLSIKPRKGNSKIGNFFSGNIKIFFGIIYFIKFLIFT